MRIWLVTSGEPIPHDNSRPHRTGILSGMLADKGHDVLWWTTAFDHQKKQYIFKKNTKKKIRDFLSIFYLYPRTSYSKNISINRLINHYQVGKNFRIESKNLDKPQLIFCSYPTIDLAYECVKFGKENNVKVIIDIRDLWPDIFLNSFTILLRPLIKLCLKKYFLKKKYIFSNCYSITAISQKYLDFSKNNSNNLNLKNDNIFPLGYHKSEIFQIDDLESKKILDHLRLSKKNFNIWFIGTFGLTYDISTVIRAASILMTTHPRINFIITGDGEKMEIWKQMSKGLKNVFFTGWVGEKEISCISSISNIGLMAYKKEAPQGLPNKIFEYMAHGLPILSSLNTESRKFIEEHKIGLYYESSNFNDLVFQIKKLFQNKKLINNMAKNCKFVFETEYSSEIIYKNLISFLEKKI